ncbi:hydantoinase B/oxoprolinase family protein [Halorubellus sp. JP-L1]|nr:hydantoinase B/oxoprolinase family protein [Halorubellus sp. JP-L1]
MRDVDPVTFQIIKHRLFRVTDEAVKALKRVSGTPVTNEGHDLMVSLYTKDGKLLTGGVGFLHHYIGASRAVEAIIDRFGGDIEEGDMFLLNDSYTAALHPPDAYIINPIFHEGELMAFSASFVHVNDIGSVDPGGFSPNSTSVYHEGFQTPGLKFMEEGEIRDDILDTLLNMSRDPEMVELDIRSQIAANNVATDRMQGMFEEHGPETVETVSEQLIEQSEAKFRKRLSELPDGTWQARQYLDSKPEDKIFTVDVTLTKEGDEMSFDFEGTSEQSEYGLNCSYWTAVGGLTAPIFPLLCYDITWNDGIFNPIEVEAPEGTIVNAQRPAPISIATVATLQTCNNLGTLTSSKLLGASEEYKERATGVWHGAHCVAQINAEFEGGGTVIDMLTDTFGGAGGARGHSDGVDLGGEVPNLVARWGNVERHESILPLMYLYRYFVSDSGGPGENRGGVGHEFAVTPVTEEGIDEINSITFGRGTDVPPSTGVFGGYPGCTSDYSVFRDTDLWDDDTGFPLSNHELNAAEQEDATWGTRSFGMDDVFYLRYTGSGGYGDPLDRDSDSVAEDVADGKITPEVARDIYGVPVTEQGDIDGSVEERQEAIREQRVDDPNHSPTVDFADTSQTELRLGANLTVVSADEERYTACESCETVLAPVSENWKDAASVTERDPTAAGPFRESHDDFRFRQFSCPSCATLLDTEVALADQPYLESRLH